MKSLRVAGPTPHIMERPPIDLVLLDPVAFQLDVPPGATLERMDGNRCAYKDAVLTRGAAKRLAVVDGKVEQSLRVQATIPAGAVVRVVKKVGGKLRVRSRQGLELSVKSKSRDQVWRELKKPDVTSDRLASMDHAALQAELLRFKPRRAACGPSLVPRDGRRPHDDWELYADPIVTKADRRVVKHGMVDVMSRHAVQRAKERRTQPGKLVQKSVVADGCRVVCTVLNRHPPRQRPDRPSATVDVPLGAGRVIGKGGCNLEGLRAEGNYVRVSEAGENSCRCTLSARCADDLAQLEGRFRALVRNLQL